MAPAQVTNRPEECPKPAVSRVEPRDCPVPPPKALRFCRAAQRPQSPSCHPLRGHTVPLFVPGTGQQSLTAGPVDLDGLGAEEGVGAVLADAVLPAEGHLVSDGERLPAARERWGGVSCSSPSTQGAPPSLGSARAPPKGSRLPLTCRCCRQSTWGGRSCPGRR